MQKKNLYELFGVKGLEAGVRPRGGGGFKALKESKIEAKREQKTSKSGNTSARVRADQAKASKKLDKKSPGYLSKTADKMKDFDSFRDLQKKEQKISKIESDRFDKSKGRKKALEEAQYNDSRRRATRYKTLNTSSSGKSYRAAVKRHTKAIRQGYRPD